MRTKVGDALEDAIRFYSSLWNTFRLADRIRPDGASKKGIQFYFILIKEPPSFGFIYLKSLSFTKARAKTTEKQSSDVEDQAQPKGYIQAEVQTD